MGMNKSRNRTNKFFKSFRFVISSIFHLGFLGILIYSFVLSLDEEALFDFGMDAFFYVTESLKYYVFVFLMIYAGVVAMHFIEIFHEIRQTKKNHSLKKKVADLESEVSKLKSELATFRN